MEIFGFLLAIIGDFFYDSPAPLFPAKKLQDDSGEAALP